jgi:hypothetical protein
MLSEQTNKIFETWYNDWNAFARDYLRIRLDPEQQEILHSCQVNPKTAVASGTARGKDFVAAAASICFLYLTPRWSEDGKMIANTKVIMTAPTDRQVGDIIVPEIRKIFKGSVYLPGSPVGYDIRTEHDEWFLTGFKSDDKNTEAWSGYHASSIMFVVTEASGISESIFNAIEGNLQGNSRLLIVFNPNNGTGYAASAMKSPAFHKIRLNSLHAPNVVAKRMINPGQVNYEWVADRVKDWTSRIDKSQVDILENDFEFEGSWYRPNDLFRTKVLGLFPKVSEGVLIPGEWIRLANDRWKELQTSERINNLEKPLRLGVDIAGMGRDNSCFAFRFDFYVKGFTLMAGAGTANHMEVSGQVLNILKQNTDAFHGLYSQAFIDTIGEGAGVFSRLQEQSIPHVHSCKFSQAAIDGGGNPLNDITGQYQFLNMRAYTYWAVRDWLNPDNNKYAMLPPDDELYQELTETKWKFRSDGKIQIEDKEELKKRIKRSPDKFDALANTFWPIQDVDPRPKKKKLAQYFY